MAKHPPVQVEIGPGGRLVPLTAFDAALISQMPRGRVYNLARASSGRSNPQLRLYWSVLQAVVDATDITPTAEHLHDQLVRACGFVRPVLNVMTGAWEEQRDSIAFEAMNQDDANVYFDRALAKLGETLGIDPTELLEEGRTRHAPAD